MLINQSIVVGEYGFFGYIPEMLRVVKFIEVAFELSALCACQFHRIGKDFVTGLFAVEDQVMLWSIIVLNGQTSQ